MDYGNSVIEKICKNSNFFLYLTLQNSSIMNKREVVGTVLKEETMEVLIDEALPKTLVLHIVNPFPGFHGDIPPEQAVKPDNIFFITKENYSWEKIIRTTNKIKELDKYKNLDASFATVMAGQTKFFAVRTHNIPSFSDIAEVQELFDRYGQFQFAKRGGRKGEMLASIKLTKFFEYEELSETCYKDLKRDHMFYIQLPGHVRWNDFKKITYAIKDDIENRNFDAALATFFKNENVYDAVRIYKPGISPEELKSIQEKYVNRMRDLHL